MWMTSNDMTYIPIEIINKIFMYIESPTNDIIKHSKYYGSSFPFLLLKKLRMSPTNKSVSLQDCIVHYHHTIYWKVAENEHPLFPGKYKLFHIYNNNNKYDNNQRDTYSENMGISMLYYYQLFVSKYYYDEYEQYPFPSMTNNITEYDLFYNIIVWISYISVMIFVVIDNW